MRNKLNRKRVRVFQACLGQGLVEYGLVLALVAVVAIGGLTLVGNNVNDIFSSLTKDMESTAKAPATANAAGGNCSNCGGGAPY
ncbi:hypothetical protein [Vampirovibrio sp.]|uniref:hypothetical protein n=1 Tax=Vampirovibrio sp. TaxID=2717857 RepID=UPI003593D783